MKTKRAGMSTGIGIALFIVGLLIGAIVLYAVSPSLIGTSTSTQSAGLSGTITFGDLASLSGSLASYGQREKIAVDLAISDINSYLKSIGDTNVQFAVTHVDTATDPAKALTGIQTLAAQGVKAFIGPLSSGEASNILQFADSNHLVLCSQSSTAISLAIPNDYLFRLVPNDAAQGKAIARELVDQGVKSIVVLNRHDTYGDGLAKEIIADFKALGGTASTNSPFAYDITTADFTSLLTSVQSDYNAAVSQVGSSKVAVVAVTFETDGAGILLKAQSSFSSLLNTSWYDTDGVATSTIVANATSGSGQVAAKVKLLSTIGEPTPTTAKSLAFNAAFNATAHQSPDAYGPAAYDCTWVLALSVLAAGKYDGAAIQKVFPSVANNYFGLIGWTHLQDSGDIAPTGYFIYEVQTVNGTPTWVKAGSYDFGTDSITWEPGMP